MSGPPPPPRPQIVSGDSEPPLVPLKPGPLSTAWRLHEQAEARYLDHDVILPDGCFYFRRDPQAVERDEAGREVHGFALRRNEGERRVTVRAINVDSRASLEEPVVHLRFDEDGVACWVRAAECRLPASSGPRGRLSPLGA